MKVKAVNHKYLSINGDAVGIFQDSTAETAL